MKSITLGELAKLVEGKPAGDPKTVITGVAGVREARPGDLTFVTNARYALLLPKTKATAAVVGEITEVPPDFPVIRVKSPDAAFAKIVGLFAPEPVEHETGIHPTAVISKEALLGKNVSVGPHAVIEAGAVIGDNTRIMALVYVGYYVTIGADCIVYPNVTLRERITIGNRCILHPGVVIGADGFGYQTRQGRHEKIPQSGTVVIEDDVEIGANSTIDRARFDRTLVRKGTKIDNLVQVAHNVVIGEHCLLVAMVGLCGSVHIGDYTVLAGKASVNGHVTIGSRVLVGGLAGVTHDVPDDSRISGFPAQEHVQELRLRACLRRVPTLLERMKELETKLRELEGKADDRP